MSDSMNTRALMYLKGILSRDGLHQYANLIQESIVKIARLEESEKELDDIRAAFENMPVDIDEVVALYKEGL